MSESLGSIGKYLVLLGCFIAIIGIVLIVADRFQWFRIGRLPGDIFIERDGWRFYFPLMTSIILSIIVSIVLWLFSRK